MLIKGTNDNRISCRKKNFNSFFIYFNAWRCVWCAWGNPEDAETLNGLKIKERKDAEWEEIPIDGIIGFSYVEGNEYFIEVEKTHLANSNRCIQYMIYTN